ncbi:MAG: winged helix-turn-helix transcriptional regulator [Candidatus Nanoarchaeia archaeon]
MRITRITIVKDAAKPQHNINSLLLTFGETLGLFSSRDKDKSCYRILIILIKALKLKEELTSDEIAAQSDLSRGTVIYHLNRLMDAGIVTSYRSTYRIGASDLEELVDMMRKGVLRMMDDLEQTAKKIDIALGIKK